MVDMLTNLVQIWFNINEILMEHVSYTYIIFNTTSST